MARPWDADVTFTSEDAALLIARQFPALAPVEAHPFGEGWDNAAFLVNARYVFRFPRRRPAARWMENETRWLPRLAPLLPLPVPVPLFAGHPDKGFPYPFAGYALLPGETACRQALSDAERAACAAPLARFLAALHHLPVDAETRALAPGDDIRRADMAIRAPGLKERLRTLTQRVDGIAVEPLLAAVDRLADTPPHEGDLGWVHGDLYARHLLLDDAHLPCGVIDWGDMHLGDPALDLSIAFSLLPAEARTSFQAAYGPLDAAAWDRARFRALHYGAVLYDFGVETGDAAIRTAGEYALRSAAI